MTEEINGETNPDIEQVQAFTDDLYDELFTDEAHLLLVFFESDNYSEQVSYHTAVGTDAQAVFDTEAQTILFDFLDHYYYSDLTDEEYFSRVFKETAEEMMGSSSALFGLGSSSNSSSSESSGQETTSKSSSGINWLSIIGGVAIFLIILAVISFVMSNLQKSEEAEILDKKKDDDLDF